MIPPEYRCISSPLKKKDEISSLILVVTYSLMTHCNASGKNEDNSDNEAESDRIALQPEKHRRVRHSVPIEAFRWKEFH